MLFVTVFRHDKPFVIPSEDHQKTTHWKSYRNVEFGFSFKYPEGLLSNFTVNTTDLGTTTLKKLSNVDMSKRADPTSYNVFFEAGGVKYDGNLKEYVAKNLPETKNASGQKIILDGVEGVRFTNIEKKDNAYFLYNVFQKEDVIYNFALLSDDPILIGANKPLLDDILTTVKFE